MLNGPVALIGLGVIGIPIAHKLSKAYKDQFAIVASGERKERLKKANLEVNGEKFIPRIVSHSNELDPLELLIVCVKNYSLETALEDIKNVVCDKTIILPLQNGIYAYDFFSKEFPNNIILQGYLQGPNTEKNGSVMRYTNSGSMHIGDQANSVLDVAAKVYAYLSMAGIEVHLEQDIKKMVWKKMMLNVAGNSVTALTNADYGNFKYSLDLQNICREVMLEFLKVAKAENIDLSESDIDEIIEYYVSYHGGKKTSMLEDVRNHRRTENEYLSGTICQLAEKHAIEVPRIQTLYLLIKIKEALYLL